ncbi:MAG: LON peptidase substrate-binding domain-containing protein, partial [Chloroflexi bacterium]|nr:LON peptidase substrate-binding domain-containing protein [Chloroflexota bacterium]
GREVGEPATPYEVGTTVRIIDVSEVAPNRYNIVTAGEHRFRLHDIQRREPYLTGDVDLWPDELGDEASCRALVAELTTAYQDYAALLRALTARSIGEVQLPEDALTLSYAVASGLLVDLTDQQALLESPSVRERLEHELTLLQRERALLRLYGTVGHMRPSDVDRFSLS